MDDHFDDQKPDLGKKRESGAEAAETSSEFLFYKEIRINSADGQLIEYKFKVFVEATPVSSSSSVTINEIVQKENDDVDDDLVGGEEEVVEINQDQSTAAAEDAASSEDNGDDESDVADKWFSCEEAEVNEKDPSLSSNLNPLYIPEVLEKIASKLALKDLMSLRLTCKKWNYALLPELQKRGKPVKLNQSNLPKFLTTMSGTPSTQQIPIIKYMLIDDDLKWKPLNTLFSSYGPTMTTLYLNIPHVSIPITSTMFRSILSTLTGLIAFTIEDDLEFHFPGDDDDDESKWKTTKPFWNKWNNKDSDSTYDPIQNILYKLKKIDFSLYGFHGAESEAFLIDFLSLSPHLETIHIRNKETSEDYDDVHNQVTLIGLQSMSSRTGGLDKLKTLHFHYFKFDDLAILIELSRNHGLALTSLDIHLWEPKRAKNVNLFYQFLKLQENSLQSLSVHEDYGLLDVQIQIPCMKTLQDLEIIFTLYGISFQLTSCDSSCETISYPALRKLTFNNSHLCPSQDDIEATNKWNSFICTSLRHPLTTLTNLTLDFGLKSLDQMKHLGYLAPNVIILDISLKNIQLITNIWVQWPKLKALTIWCVIPAPDGTDINEEGPLKDGLLDEVITGISAQFHGFLNMFASTTNQLQVLNQMKTQPGISDMKCLTKFTLHMDLGDDLDSFMTDISAYYGFGLPNTQLTSLWINVWTPKISENGKKVIRESMGENAEIWL